MKVSSNITRSLNADTRQAGGGLKTIMNWHLFFTEGVTKVHQSVAAETILDRKSVNELAKPYSWVDATESVYFLMGKYEGPTALASTISRSPTWTHKARPSHPNRQAWLWCPLPSPSLQALAVVQGALGLESHQHALWPRKNTKYSSTCLWAWIKKKKKKGIKTLKNQLRKL